MPIMPVVLLNKPPDSFYRQAIMLEFYFNPSSLSCIKIYSRSEEGVRSSAVWRGEFLKLMSISTVSYHCAHK